MNKQQLIVENNLAIILQKPVLTFKEALLFTGLSDSSLYKLVMRRQIPHSKPSGRKLYFDAEQLRLWMLSNPIATEDQLKQSAVNYTIANPFNAGGNM
jgi:predicted DNA-binding transcriptional regulator AlpA